MAKNEALAGGAQQGRSKAPEPWVCNLVQALAHQEQPEEEDDDDNNGRHKPPPHLADESSVRDGPIEGQAQRRSGQWPKTQC